MSDRLNEGDILTAQLVYNNSVSRYVRRRAVLVQSPRVSSSSVIHLRTDKTGIILLVALCS